MGYIEVNQTHTVGIKETYKEISAMIVSELKLYNFRKFHAENGEPGLSVCFHKGLNALIGENDSGKTAVIDALKLVLLTQSNDYVRPVEEDFYTDGKLIDAIFR